MTAPAGIATAGALRARKRGSRPRFLYAIFALALAPLAFSMLAPAADASSEAEERLIRTLASKPGLDAEIMAAGSDAEMTEDQFFGLLPDGRLEGAHLPHHTWVHWIYAAAAAGLFVLMIRTLFEPGNSTVVQLVLALMITATVGIISLIAFQWIATASGGVWLTGRSIVVLLFYVVKFIGFSYSAALDPENGFLLSLLGFTFGVGLCEELTKVLPAIVMQRDGGRQEWRLSCALGLASGVGFGVAEGIMYSSQYYNGVEYADVYLVRFISCVALHAVWAAAASIVAAERIGALDSNEGSEFISALVMAIGVPALLHGLYDTLLKRDMPGYALATAAASFVWLIFVVERARSFDEPERTGFGAMAAGAS